MSNSLERLTNMLIGAKNPYQEELIYNLYALIKEVVSETVKQELEVNINASMNGRRFSSEVLEDEVRKMIIDSIN